MSGGGSSSEVDANFGQKLLALFLVVLLGAIGGILIKLIRGIKFGKKHLCFPGKQIKGFCANVGCCKKIVIPPLIGEIVLGALARNFIPDTVMDKYDDEWASYVRQMCLGIILLRGGMELEFKSMGIVVILLTIVPPVIEGIVIALVAHGWLDMEFKLALTLGSIIGAVSPAVLVPCMMNLQVRGYGIKKGIPLILIAASSFNDIFNITLFSVTSTIAKNDTDAGDGDSVGKILLVIVLEIIGGIAAGIVLGFAMIPLKKVSHAIKAPICIVITFLFILISELFHFPESKYIGIVTYGYMCYRIWGLAGKPEKLLATVWQFLTPFLFGTIGGALKFDEMDTGSIGPSIVIILIGVLVRGITTIGSTASVCNFNLQEQAFFSLAWIPKATVQAAIGGQLYTWAKTEGVDEYLLPANQMLTMAVISVIICAPAGAILTITFGQKWLHRYEAPAIKPSDKKYSKWDIVYIYITDFYQRKEEAQKYGQNASKVNFFMTPKEKAKRLHDKQSFLYQLKLYKEQMENPEVIEEIEQHRQEIAREMGSDLEFASAFSSLSNKFESETDKNKKREEKMITLQKLKENQKKAEEQAKIRQEQEKNGQTAEPHKVKLEEDKEHQELSLIYHDDLMEQVDEDVPDSALDYIEKLKIQNHKLSDIHDMHQKQSSINNNNYSSTNQMNKKN